MAAVLGIAIHQHPPLWKFAVQYKLRLSESERRARYLSHLKDCIALAEGTTTVVAIEAKWEAIYAQDRIEESRQGMMPV